MSIKGHIYTTAFAYSIRNLSNFLRLFFFFCAFISCSSSFYIYIQNGFDEHHQRKWRDYCRPSFRKIQRQNHSHCSRRTRQVAWQFRGCLLEYMLRFHKIGHKDGLYQTALAERLPFTSFRFDLSGHGDSEGQFNFGHIAVRLTYKNSAWMMHIDDNVETYSRYSCCCSPFWKPWIWSLCHHCLWKRVFKWIEICNYMR